MKLKIKKGDIVKVTTGEYKGTQGKVLEVIPGDGKVLVEGCNLVSKATKPNAKNPNGGIVKKEAPIHISNLMVVDAKGNATRVGRRLNEDGKLVRYSKKSGEEIK
ncbi:MAG: 50S ribosomal protein L24 [Bacteroidales bacterium]|nr:50S ribosomal protein L24 [Bacteroidales bacterium]